MGIAMNEAGAAIPCGARMDGNTCNRPIDHSGVIHRETRNGEVWADWRSIVATDEVRWGLGGESVLRALAQAARAFHVVACPPIDFESCRRDECSTWRELLYDQDV